jgi:hypothetical protein
MIQLIINKAFCLCEHSTAAKSAATKGSVKVKAKAKVKVKSESKSKKRK